MSRGLKIYALVLVAAIGLTVWSLAHEPGRVRELNQVLASDAVLASYPYPFRVVSLEGTTAVMSSPRSPAAPVINMIGAVYPELTGVSETDPAFETAQVELAQRQARARDLILSEPDVEAVNWRLDEAWLRERGIPIIR